MSENVQKREPVVTTVRQKILLIFFGLALFFVGLAVVEGALTVFGIGDDLLYDDPFVGFAPGKDLFEEKTIAGQSVWKTRPEKLAFFNDQQFPVDKDAKAYRIFTLGGSTTAGRPYDDKVAFARWLELYLDAMDPSRDWQAINAGAISYASYRVTLLMRELVRYQPDLFVVYTGHNEFLEERSYSDIIHQNPLLKRARFWLGSRRFFVLARQAISSLRETPAATDGELGDEVETRLDGWTGLDRYQRDTELEKSIVEHFEYNLRQMVRIARDHGADVIFVKPISNLKDFSPFKSQHGSGVSPDAQDRVVELIATGRAQLAAQDNTAALASFDEAAALDPEYADSHFWKGRARLAAGDPNAAYGDFVRAKDLDVAPLRALDSLVDLVGSVGAERDVPVIDLPSLLAADSQERYGHTSLGNEYLLDHVHPDVAIHSLIAEQVISILTDRGIAQPTNEWSAEARQAIYDREIGAFDREYYAVRDLNLSKVLGWAGKLEEAEVPLERAAEVLGDHPEVQLNLGIVYQKTGRLQEARAKLQLAAQLAPESPEAHFNLGVVYGRLEQLPQGVAALEQALRLRPDYPEARYNLGVLQRRLGNFANSIAELERALVDQPDAAEIHGQLALAYREQGRFDEAIASFRRALEEQSENPATRTALAITYGRQGKLEEAISELQKVIAAHPDFTEAHYNLAVVYSQQGREEEARKALAATLELEPGHAEANNNLGIQYASRGELETARQHLVRALETDPEYADAYFNLGIVYDNAGLPEEASRMLERAVELQPETPRFNFALAMMHFALGRTESARRLFEVAEKGGIAIPPEISRQLSNPS